MLRQALDRDNGSPSQRMRGLERSLGSIDSALIVIGIVIGSGIFILPNVVAEALPSSGAILAVWAISGLLSYFGALAYAELGAMMPETGGQYVYLREAYGPLSAFVCGWTFFLAVLAGGTAFLAEGFSLYLGSFVHLSPLASKGVAFSLVLTLSAINYVGLREGVLVQRVFTSLKIGGILLLIGSAFRVPSAPQVSQIAHPSISVAHFGTAMMACLMAYNGWTYISFVAGEVRTPERTLPRALNLAIASVIVIYLMANGAYLRLLSVHEIASSDRVGATLATRTLGPYGAAIISVIVLISIVGAINGCIITGARIPFAQSRDGLFFKSFGVVHPRFHTPAFAIMIQAAWACVLLATGSYKTLYSYSIVAGWIFYTMTVGAVLVLRRKLPDLPRPYKMWAYPYTMVVFVAVSLWFILNSFATQPVPSLCALAIAGSGVPAYWFWRKPPVMAHDS
jgi:basic amino acid/polyamine antiporter, APA family